jgi:hypothetical protein
MLSREIIGVRTITVGRMRSFSILKFVPHRKHYVSITTTNRLMLSRDIIAVYCKSHICGENVEFWYVRAMVHILNHNSLKSLSTVDFA